MPVVETSIWIGAPIQEVFAIAKHSAAYPEYMKDVQSVTPVETDGSRQVMDYVGIVPQFRLKVRWRQEEVWDDATFSSTFRQLKGDYDRLEGKWQFTEENGGTRFDQYLDYEYNVPTLGALVKKVVHGLVTKNLENIALAFKQKAESR
jgi:ribosome-associated toxin RatA of RatAB toxin-antitoxin module